MTTDAEEIEQRIQENPWPAPAAPYRSFLVALIPEGSGRYNLRRLSKLTEEELAWVEETLVVERRRRLPGGRRSQ